MTPGEKAAAGSIVIGLAVLGLKFLAWWLTGSVALLSDALESIINVVAAGAAFFALRVAAKPPDAEHPFGHHKAEYFSAVLEGVLIVIASLSIVREAWLDWLDPKPLDAPAEGLAINGLATVFNAGWSYVLIRMGRRTRSPALVADGKHLFADVVTSLGVLAGVLLVALTGWLRLDPALAAIVAVNILWTGWSLIRDSASGLLDAAAPDDLVEKIRHVVSIEGRGAIEAHALRTRVSGPATFLDFHLVVPGEMRVSEAHAICDRIEEALKTQIHDLEVTIHIEPSEKAELGGIPVA